MFGANNISMRTQSTHNKGGTAHNGGWDIISAATRNFQQVGCTY